MGREWNDGLAIQIILVEEGEHHSWVGSPPYRTTDEDGVIIIDVFNLALERWLFPLFGLLLCHIYKIIIRQVIILISYDFELVATGNLLNLIGNKFGIADLYVSYSIVFSCMREEHYQYFSFLFHNFLFFCRTVATA